MVFLRLLLFCSTAGFASPSVDANGYHAGLRLAQEKKFSEAAEQFQSEYLRGKDFSALYYNWGLVAYELEKNGLSVGLFRRALYLDPDLSVASQALDFVAKKTPGAKDDLAPRPWASWRDSVFSRLNLNKLLFLTWLLLVFSGFLLIRYWGRRNKALKNEAPLPPAPTLGLFFASLFVLCSLLSVAKGLSLLEVHATVIHPNVTLRTGPSTEDNAVFDLLEGFDVVVRQAQNSWALVTITSGVSGWVPTESLFQHTGSKRLW